MIAEIVVDISAKQVNRSFDYAVPSFLESVIAVGYRVKVIFGSRLLTGFVVGLKNKTDYKKKLKEIIDLVDVWPILNQEFVDLAKYIAENNFSYYAKALQTMIPTALKVKYQKVAILEQPNSELKAFFKNKKEINLNGLNKEDLALIYKGVKEGTIKLDTKIKRRQEKLITFVYVKDDTLIPKSQQGKELLAYLIEINEAVAANTLVEDCGFSKNVIKTLIEQNILGTYTEEVLDFPTLKAIANYNMTMTAEQRKVYESIRWNVSQTYLLHGVTGSGKTLVYIEWIENAIRQGRQALMLVPEIALTPQIMAIFTARFGSDIAIIHSRLSVGEKYNSWRRILKSEIKIVVGTRSAIFAPLNNIGIIIIDEEHEASYIQENDPRYNALDIAKIRSLKHNCPLVLGSATPNIEDYYKALNGDYTLLKLPKRANQKPMPTKTVVDMALELKSGNNSVFSNLLQQKLLKNYHENQQSILFLNRRGYSSFVMCRSCGEVIKCPHCDVSLTYHSSSNLLKCHYCGYSEANVKICPKCGSFRIRFVGSGTEKVLEAITAILPEARVLRVDLDTTKKPCDYEQAFTIFKNHEADIMVGTQMIAKGLDFANVTLVGIVNADLALNYPSYDANAKAYNLIEQVAGRAGRASKNGEVIIQTYKPEHFVIKAAAYGTYEDFFEQELQLRKLTKMPPYSLALEVTVSASDASLAYKEALKLVKACESVAKNSEILGPVEAIHFKMNDVFRFTIQLKIEDEELWKKLQEIYPLYQNKSDVIIKIVRM